MYMDALKTVFVLGLIVICFISGAITIFTTNSNQAQNASVIFGITLIFNMVIIPSKSNNYED